VLAALLWVAGQRLDWLQHGHGWLRAAWMAGVLPLAAAAYLGTLWLAGLRLAHFRRRG
jgi:peptidoglycan biosynthesis protein MviN/MurJ (putative lipid II flippase)